MSMEHYVCRGGCKGNSLVSGVCQDKNCPNYGKPLEKCECVDDKHRESFSEVEQSPKIEENN